MCILLTIALVVYLTLVIVTVAKLDLLDPLENIVSSIPLCGFINDRVSAIALNNFAYIRSN
jgi:hypothetical protein